MHKILTSSLFLILFVLSSTMPFTVTHAANEQVCIANCLQNLTSTDTKKNQTYCQNLCKTKLPPVIKPSLLPGPQLYSQQSGSTAINYVVERLLPKTASRFLTLVSLVAVLGIMYGGILSFIALGDPEKAKKGRNTAIYSAVGLIIALLSYAIVQIVSSLPINTIT